MYVCGPTVYNYVHIGNARGPVVFGVLADAAAPALRRAALRAQHHRRRRQDQRRRRGAGRADLGRSPTASPPPTARTWPRSAWPPPDVEPDATAHIAQIIAMIERLVADGHAYAAEGHVLFSSPASTDYGKLSRRDPEDMLAGARVEVAPYKRDPGDFVLWKPSTADLPGWDSPWGRGRPGWHIECSAMAERAPGRDHRHPCRRRRPAVPAPRERDRAERMRARRQDVRALLAAQRHADFGGAQDVEVARQRREGARPGARASAGGAALCAVVGALPAAAGLVARR